MKKLKPITLSHSLHHRPGKLAKVPSFEFQFGTGETKKKFKRSSLLNTFYDYDPKGKSIKFMQHKTLTRQNDV